LVTVAAARAPPAGHVGSGPRSTSSVIPRASTGWRTWKRPPWKLPVCDEPSGSLVVSFTLPRRVSTIEPTGTDAVPGSATARAAPGRRTVTLPPVVATPMLWPSCGGAAGGSDGCCACCCPGAPAAEPDWPFAAGVVKVVSAPWTTASSWEATRRTW
jgi:hypothetical protein